MVITSYGNSCFKVSSGEIVLVFDPPSHKSKFKSPYFQTDIVLISHNHDDHNGKDVLHGKNDIPPFVIEHPGEYEYKGVNILGVPSFHDAQGGKKHGLNTIYQAELENVTLLHMGDFGEKDLRDEIKEKIKEVDVLFVPIGGETVLEPASAASIVSKIEPRIVIPMHYDTLPSARKKAVLSEFLEEMGAHDIRPETKFTLKKKDLPTDETRVVVLEQET